MYGHSYGWDLCTIASQPLLNNIIMKAMLYILVAKNIIQYIHDLLINRHLKTKSEYPHELKLRKTTESRTTLSYLDILITIDNGIHRGS